MFNSYFYTLMRRFAQRVKMVIFFLAIGFLLGSCAKMSHAAETHPWIESLANAIYKAEGGANTRHPYGILAKYKTTTPRQACINTIKSNLRRWEKAGRPADFIAFMAKSYCPVGAANDPTGLNKNWVRNVKYFMREQGQPITPLL